MKFTAMEHPISAVVVHLPPLEPRIQKKWSPAGQVMARPNKGVSHIGGAVGLPTEVSHIILESFLNALLVPAVHDISMALQKVLPPNQKMIEVIGIGTDHGTLGVLIGLLRQAGFHATIASGGLATIASGGLATTSVCAAASGGVVRQGFSGPTAVLRARGGDAPGLFLQQVGSALAGVINARGSSKTASTPIQPGPGVALTHQS